VEAHVVAVVETDPYVRLPGRLRDRELRQVRTAQATGAAPQVLPRGAAVGGQVQLDHAPGHEHVHPEGDQRLGDPRQVGRGRDQPPVLEKRAVGAVDAGEAATATG